MNGIIQTRLRREQRPRSDAEKKLQDLKPTLPTALARALGKGASSFTSASCFSSCVPVRSRAELVYSLLAIMN